MAKQKSEEHEHEEKAKKRERGRKKAEAEKKLRKERLQNHWKMMAWLTNFIEQNKFNWEERHTFQEKEKAKQNDMENIELKRDGERQSTQRNDKKSDSASTWERWRTRKEERNLMIEESDMDKMRNMTR